MREDGVDVGLIVARVIVAVAALFAVGIGAVVTYFVVRLVAPVMVVIVVGLVGEIVLHGGLVLAMYGVVLVPAVIFGWAVIRVVAANWENKS